MSFEIGDAVTVAGTGEQGSIVDVFPDEPQPYSVCMGFGGGIRAYDEADLVAG